MKFSIVTVTYNASRWLEKTLLSVLSQTYPDIEYILVDGGSTDSTTDIIRQYESGIATWISEPDHGLYDAMNKGLRLATGDYVWFLNAGDTLYTADTVQQIVSRLKKRKRPDVIYGETSLVDASGKSLGLRRLKAPEKLNWKSFRMGMLVCHQSFIVRRETAPFYDTAYRLASDFDWCIRCLKQASGVYNTHQVLSCFLEDGLSSVHRKEALKERYRIMCRYYGRPLTVLRHVWFALRFYTAKWIKGRV